MPEIAKKLDASVPGYFSQKYRAGFTLPEMMLALSVGSMIIMAATQVFPQLHKQISILQQHYHLELALSQVMAVVEKDLRRAGFCHGECQGKAITTASYPSEASNSCLIVAYDLNRNGRWEGAKHQESEYFGYRLRKKTLEGQRGELNCFGGGWEKLLDPKDITITHFSVSRLPLQTSDQVYRVQLAGQKRGNPTIHRQLTYTIRGDNL
ncbi:prepilin peptidase-dependent protein [Yersinia enterocolitica]|uniref:Prepilin peptidase dependent protein B n=1 Tax=Yersinia enterocolitica TaxID=630 RepID=A0A9P1PU14_YEREN|nr:prepilin peptidase-dependent protein [Yersinia enterocolitica]EKN3339776.1 prepilin peptidase-dependent protein [Yersinia enterocolitica]EKN3468414.1 prepilin peptidase-dependent protein [Yersinia enterocolitica]EKN3530050.1 prepilin peptidase-dependent protein [Yersinia enterocolitica]EKN3950281.1 prepilin peptidase-dependent protein [Yersinia enterocolitica]EKN3990934.1 prepilin peptidase-dependent protein [Yersinia enterocolitica]